MTNHGGQWQKDLSSVPGLFHKQGLAPALRPIDANAPGAIRDVGISLNLVLMHLPGLHQTSPFSAKLLSPYTGLPLGGRPALLLPAWENPFTDDGIITTQRAVVARRPPQPYRRATGVSEDGGPVVEEFLPPDTV